MPLKGRSEVRELQFENGVKILTGPRATRALVAGDYPAAPIGSLYLQSVATGSTGRIYLKTTHTGNGVASDWTKVTTSAAD